MRHRADADRAALKASRDFSGFLSRGGRRPLPTAASAAADAPGQGVAYDDVERSTASETRKVLCLFRIRVHGLLKQGDLSGRVKRRASRGQASFETCREARAPRDLQNQLRTVALCRLHRFWSEWGPGQRPYCHHGKGGGGHRCLFQAPELAGLPPPSASCEVAALVSHNWRGVPPIAGASGPSWRGVGFGP